jgi:hypothetical protein
MNVQQSFRPAPMLAASEASYREYRAARLDHYPVSAGDLVVEIGGLTDLDDDPGMLRTSEYGDLRLP